MTNPFTDPTLATPLNGYVFFYQSRRVEIRAQSLHEAKQQAVSYFRAPKTRAHLVHGALAERADGTEVIHDGASL